MEWISGKIIHFKHEFKCSSYATHVTVLGVVQDQVVDGCHVQSSVLYSVGSMFQFPTAPELGKLF